MTEIPNIYKRAKNWLYLLNNSPNVGCINANLWAKTWETVNFANNRNDG